MSDVALWTPPRLAQPQRYDAFWNALVSFMGTALPLQNKTAAEVALASAPPPDRFGFLLGFDGGVRMLAVPVSFPFATVVGADLAVEDLALMPPPLRDAMLDGMVALSTLILPETDQGRLGVVASGTLGELGGPPAAELRWFRASLSGFSPAPAVFDIGVTIEALGTIFGFAITPRQVWPSLRTKLTCDGFATVGRITVPVGEARKIRDGTVIVLDRALDPGLIDIRLGPNRYNFQAQNGQWALSSIADLDQPLRTDTMSSAPALPGTPASTADLAIAIDFDIGRVSVPLSDLESWQRGSLVALSVPTAAEGIEVTLRANGQVIGRGDLVQIDDRLAVRVTAMTLGT